MEALPIKLANKFGSVFSLVSIRRMCRFYKMFPIWLAVSIKLSWYIFIKKVVKSLKIDKNIVILMIFTMRIRKAITTFNPPNQNKKEGVRFE